MVTETDVFRARTRCFGSGWAAVEAGRVQALAVRLHCGAGRVVKTR
jgi:hypothetical protein